MKKYAIGIDYGTLSGRALLVDIQSGKELASSVYEYPHKVMDEFFLDGSRLPSDFALQHPKDYIEVLENTIPDVIKKAGISSEDVACIGFDFTACTVIPLDGDYMPLCFSQKFKTEPHAYVKLWKHHGAQKYADIINEKAKDSDWIKRYGGKVSCEWLLPKVMEIADKCPEVYDAACRFAEAGDWIVSLITGKEVHNAAMAGFKGLWHGKDNWLDESFIAELNPKFKNLLGTKISKTVNPMNSLGGYITKTGSEITTLPEGTPVAVSNIDAHSALPGTGIVEEGQLLIIMGTSTCQIFMGREESFIDGISGVVDGGICEGLYAYEAGQSATGDSFDWFVKNAVPESYSLEAKNENISIHKLLRRKLQGTKPGASGLMALDWFGGNRTPLSDTALSGMIVGLNLNTKPEEIYRALIESTAFGTRKIIDTFKKGGVDVTQVFASGGIADKDEMTMQIYADVLNKEIKISGSPLAGALGSAMSACIACGIFKTPSDAAKVMSKVKDITYKPIKENVEIYRKLYAKYDELFEYFGKSSSLMKDLKKLM